ncbi:sulfotransferase [Sphingomonas sp. PL-96]|uniref:sulfotransferase n=1 Tax=Sphingomonas sp. PL-96 TaxID=2887201 RepID=UPI001E567C61|nr:sulfotransferase [Sphingomonas sp. PL-96]MCC2976568.1 sulfotransferase [Sphingomonas sp. PL-96]
MKRAILRLAKVHLVGDLYERACDRGVSLPLDAKRRERLACIARAGALFIHIPKNAGMSISAALYDQQIKHASIRYYQLAAPDLVRRVVSFAVVRDPVARFASSLSYAQAGGGKDNAVSEPFRDRYRSFRTADDALDHLETATSLYQLDHIFRPQSWYLRGIDGALAVDRIFAMSDTDALQAFLDAGGGPKLRHLNASDPRRPSLSAKQIDRIERFYAKDRVLFDSVAGRGSRSDAQTGSSHGATPPWQPPLTHSGASAGAAAQEPAGQNKERSGRC